MCICVSLTVSLRESQSSKTYVLLLSLPDPSLSFTFFFTSGDVVLTWAHPQTLLPYLRPLDYQHGWDAFATAYRARYSAQRLRAYPRLACFCGKSLPLTALPAVTRAALMRRVEKETGVPAPFEDLPEFIRNALAKSGQGSATFVHAGLDSQHRSPLAVFYCNLSPVTCAAFMWQLEKETRVPARFEDLPEIVRNALTESGHGSATFVVHAGRDSKHRSPLAVFYLVLTRSGSAPYEHAFWMTCSLPTGTIFSLPYPVLFWKHTEHHNSQSKWKGWVSTSLIFSQVPRETFAISFNTHTLSGARAKTISRSGYVGKKKGTKLTITVTQVASP